MNKDIHVKCKEGSADSLAYQMVGAYQQLTDEITRKGHRQALCEIFAEERDENRVISELIVYFKNHSDKQLPLPPDVAVSLLEFCNALYPSAGKTKKQSKSTKQSIHTAKQNHKKRQLKKTQSHQPVQSKSEVFNQGKLLLILNNINQDRSRLQKLIHSFEARILKNFSHTIKRVTLDLNESVVYEVDHMRKSIEFLESECTNLVQIQELDSFKQKLQQCKAQLAEIIIERNEDFCHLQGDPSLSIRMILSTWAHCCQLRKEKKNFKQYCIMKVEAFRRNVERKINESEVIVNRTIQCVQSLKGIGHYSYDMVRDIERLLNQILNVDTNILTTMRMIIQRILKKINAHLHLLVNNYSKEQKQLSIFPSFVRQSLENFSHELPRALWKKDETEIRRIISQINGLYQKIQSDIERSVKDSHKRKKISLSIKKQFQHLISLSLAITHGLSLSPQG
ncbi:MAG: hypothetical protein HQL32_01055 [Planctomycetes bacterium]|nr:hypothetical protein [Planctomycetota bacterium]